MSLSAKQKKQYRTLGHQLKPIVSIGQQGLSAAVLAELDRALTDHELLKVKITAADKDQRNQLAQALCTATQATLVQQIGHTLLLLRPSTNPNPKHSNLIRLTLPSR